MPKILVIYRRELHFYFASPWSYTIAGAFWLLAGFFFVSMLLGPQGVIAQALLRDRLAGDGVPPLDVAYQFLQLFLSLLGTLALFVLPMLSMGLYTGERQRGTLELLATSPVATWAVALGKLLAVLTFFTFMITPLLGWEVIALSTASPPFNLGWLILGHLGLLLLAGAVLSLGMFISSLTESTILAGVLTFGLTLSLWLVDLLTQGWEGTGGDFLQHLSLVKSYNTFVQGILDVSSLGVLLSYIFLGVFLTSQSVESLRRS